MGAKAVHDLRRSAILTSFWGAVICVILSVAVLLFGEQGIDLMTTAPDVRAEARLYLIYVVLSPVLGMASWMLDGIFIGATRSRDMRNMMLISTIAYFVSVIPLMALFGNHGLWLGMLVSFVVRGVTLGLRYPALERAASE